MLNNRTIFWSVRVTNLVVALVLTVGCTTTSAQSNKPQSASNSSSGGYDASPGEETNSSPFMWKQRCQTNCRGCTDQERGDF